MYQITKQHIYRDARDAYFNGGKTQKEIAREVGITDRTLRNWIKEGCWDRLRQNANIAPALMLEMFCSQLVDLQKKIAARPEAKRMPKTKEVDKQNKILNCILKMKNYPFEIFKTLAYGVNPVSSLVPYGEEMEEIPEPEIDAETPLAERYMAYEGKKEEKIFQQEIAGAETVQIIENELDGHASGDAEEEENDEKEEKVWMQETKRSDLMPVCPGGNANEETNDQRIKFDSTRYFRKKNVKLPSGAIWLQKGDIYDPELQQVRRMTPEEWDLLLGLGVGRRDFEGWCIAMP